MARSFRASTANSTGNCFITSSQKPSRSGRVSPVSLGYLPTAVVRSQP
jgi:hypothetical protein